ncbi:MAG: hypothetical protein ACLTMP_10325 [Eggerthella lenta]
MLRGAVAATKEQSHGYDQQARLVSSSQASARHLQHVLPSRRLALVTITVIAGAAFLVSASSTSSTTSAS